MRPLKLLAAALIVVGFPLVILAFWLTGFFGGLIVILVFLAIGLRFAGFLGLFIVPARALSLATSIIVIGAISILFIGGTKYYYKTQGEEVRRRSAVAREAVVKNKIEIILYPDHYTWVPFPEHQWGHFVSDNDFRVRLTQKNAEGKQEFDFLAGKKWPYLGDEIPDNKLGLKSLTGGQIRIGLFLRPKT